MNKDEGIECTLENIKIIEEQIKFFQKKSILFWKNRDYVNRIELLETIRGYLYRRLEEKLDNE